MESLIVWVLIIIAAQVYSKIQSKKAKAKKQQNPAGRSSTHQPPVAQQPPGVPDLLSELKDILKETQNKGQPSPPEMVEGPEYQLEDEEDSEFSDDIEETWEEEEPEIIKTRKEYGSLSEFSTEYQNFPQEEGTFQGYQPYRPKTVLEKSPQKKTPKEFGALSKDEMKRAIILSTLLGPCKAKETELRR